MFPLATFVYTLLGICLLIVSMQLVWRGWRAHRQPLGELIGVVARLETSGPEESERYYLYLNSEEASLARFDIPFHFFAHLRVGDRIRVRYFHGMNWIRELRILEGRHPPPAGRLRRRRRVPERQAIIAAL
ncbi:MAG TPA: hypothetical protein VHL09_17185, partial [Dehalococcoidia bacterium]|nr:hypothetical protein [Dehalococcoidia bacterium]